MKRDTTFYELLDRYRKGTLSERELTDFNQRMASDSEFRQEAESYLSLTSAIKSYGTRRDLKHTLDKVHDEMDIVTIVPSELKSKVNFKKYWRWTAVAASIAIFTSVATLFMTKSIEAEENADYKALRRNVDQIQRSQKQIIEDLAESKPAPVKPGKYSGSGFLISGNGYLITSHHVIMDADSVLIENEVYGSLKAVIVHTDAKADLTLLKIVTPDFKLKKSLPFAVSSQEADLGEYVYTLGFPREDIVFGEGSVSASSGYRHDQNAYQISVPVNPGNSGGPLLNNNGDLVGVVSGVQTATSGTAFAVKSTKLLELVQHEALDTLSKPVILPKRNSIKNSGRVEQIKKWREFVFMVRVYKGK